MDAMDSAIKNGRAGMCMKGKVQTDFVAFDHLCDGWTGREGSSVATEGQPLDKLPEEIKDDLGEN